LQDIGTITAGAVWADSLTAAPAIAQNRSRSAGSVSSRNDCPWENPADGPRTALPRIRSRDSFGTDSSVNVRTIRRRRTTS
jgi:hypothetical protein